MPFLINTQSVTANDAVVKQHFSTKIVTVIKSMIVVQNDLQMKGRKPPEVVQTYSDFLGGENLEQVNFKKWSYL